MQSVKLLILFGLWLYGLAAISFLIFPFRGELIGLTIAIVYLAMIYSLMDKWILLFLLAIPAKRGDKLMERLSNLSYGHNLGEINLYYSRIGLNNVLSLDWAGKKIVIIDKRLIPSEKLDESFRSTITLFKNKSIKKQSNLMFIYFVYNLPIVVIEMLFGKFRLFNLLIGVWTTPFKLIVEANEKGKLVQPIRSNYTYSDTSFDTFTSELVKILGIYRDKESDLVSVVFKKERV